MAKTKADWLKEAKDLGIKVDSKATIAQMKELIEAMAVESSKKKVASKEKTADEKPAMAKAGKRSAKAIKEAEEKQAKASRTAAQSSEALAEEERKPKSKAAKPARSRLERRGKKYRDKAKLIDKSKEYSLKDALELAVKTAGTKFDGSLELHIRLNVDPKQADQNIRDSVVLPEGSGKSVDVAVLADEELAKKAKQAGAKTAGEDVIFNALDKEKIDFDVLIAIPDMMAKLSKYARVLGPKGLMPNPKSGTVTKDVENAVKDALGGKVEYRVDSSGIIHLAAGKLSFGKDKLVKNASAVFDSVKAKKPASIKGPYVKNIYVTTTMGPSIRVKSSELS
jgi:large subunit ribosomal protein L1